MKNGSSRDCNSFRMKKMKPRRKIAAVAFRNFKELCSFMCVFVENVYWLILPALLCKSKYKTCIEIQIVVYTLPVLRRDFVRYPIFHSGLLKTSQPQGATVAFTASFLRRLVT